MQTTILFKILIVWILIKFLCKTNKNKDSSKPRYISMTKGIWTSFQVHLYLIAIFVEHLSLYWFAAYMEIYVVYFVNNRWTIHYVSFNHIHKTSEKTRFYFIFILIAFLFLFLMVINNPFSLDHAVRQCLCIKSCGCIW